jgi:hypothetical protein
MQKELIGGGAGVHKVILTLVIFFSLVIPSYAAPCYGTRMPQQKKFFTGAQTNIIFKRYLENSFGKIRSAQDFLLLSYGLCDWLSIDLKGGAGNIKQRPSDSSEIDYTSSFAGGYGFRLKFYEAKKIKAVFGFQHISVHPKMRRVGEVKNRAILDDWQVSLLASRDLGKITPYLGMKWSRLDYIHKVDDNRKRVMSDLTKSLGAIAGIDIPLNEKFWLNLEGQFFDTEACAISLNYSF